MIEWNKVTWYSKLGAIILFLLILPVITFYLGMQYELTKELVGASGGIYTTTLNMGLHSQSATSTTQNGNQASNTPLQNIK